MKVGLCVVPFYECYTTSYAFGTLKANLQEHGVETKCFNLHFDFAKQIGFEKYFRMSDQKRIFEAYWTFARAWFSTTKDRDFLCRSSLGSLFLAEIRLEAEKFVQRIAEYDWSGFGLIILDTFMHQLNAALAIGKAIKFRFPNTLIGYSGISVSGPMGVEYAKKIEWADIVFLGDLDDSVLEVCERISHGNDFCNIAGTAFKKDGKILFQQATHQIDMDQLPVPDYKEYMESIDEYLDHPFFMEGTDEQFYLGFEFSRGCDYGLQKLCPFCSYVEESGFNYNVRSPEKARFLLASLHVKYPQIKKFVLYDPLCPKKLISSVFGAWPSMKQELNLDNSNSVIYIQTKPWHTKEEVRILSEAGAIGVFYGIEHLHSDAQRALLKGQVVCQSLAILKWSKAYGMRPEWWFLLQIPGENKEQQWLEETIPLIRKIYHLPPPSLLKYVVITKQQPYFHRRDELDIHNIRPAEEYEYILPEYINKKEAAYWWVYDNWCNYQNYATFISAIEEWRQRYTKGSYLIFTSWNVIEDSRGDQKKIIEISDTQRQILDFCDTPQKQKTIHAKFLEEDLAELLENDLLYYGDNKYLSLVESIEHGNYDHFKNYLIGVHAKHHSMKIPKDLCGERTNSRWK